MSFENKIEILAERRPFKGAIELTAITRIDHDRIAVGLPITMKEQLSDASILGPTITLQMEQAQSLIDELWRCGLRPSEGTGSAGMLAATERHLKDMQKITFASLDNIGKKVNK